MTIVREASALDNEVLESEFQVPRPARCLVAYHWNVKTGLARFRYEGGGSVTVDSRLQSRFLPPHTKQPEGDPR